MKHFDWTSVLREGSVESICKTFLSPWKPL